MLSIYLPIAEMAVDPLMILALGGAVGILSGMFGVGGGFMLTPLLILLGIPAPIAVATAANQVVGASVSGAIAHWRRGHVDIRMGAVLLVGGLIGSGLGVLLFGYLQRLGHIDLVITLLYVVVLGLIGISMAVESVLLLLRPGYKAVPARRFRDGGAPRPFWLRFPQSGLTMPVVLPLAVGAFGGVLASLMGVGGGFVMVPLMVYVLGMPTRVVIGTSLFQIVFVTANVTVLHAVHTQSVDAFLAVLLLIGGVIGAQYGVRLGYKLKAEQLRGLLALLVLVVAGRLAWDLVSRPLEMYLLVE